MTAHIITHLIPPKIFTLFPLFFPTLKIPVTPWRIGSPTPGSPALLGACIPRASRSFGRSQDGGQPSAVLLKVLYAQLGCFSLHLSGCLLNAIVQYFEDSFALTFFGIGMKINVFQSCGHCWFSKFADILSAAFNSIIF